MAQQTMTQAQAQAQAKGDVTCKTIRYIEHREEMLAYQKKYHEENHDAFIQYQKAYYQRTKEAKKERYNVLVHCDCCKKDVRRGAIANHRKTKKHIRNEASHSEASHSEASHSEASHSEASHSEEASNEAACGKAGPSNEAACGKSVDGNEEVDGEVIMYAPYSKCALQIDDLDEEIVYAPLKQ
jgi:hypothetical protein